MARDGHENNECDVPAGLAVIATLAGFRMAVTVQDEVGKYIAKHGF